MSLAYLYLSAPWAAGIFCEGKMEKRTVILDEKAVNSISYEIIERNKGVSSVCLVGILSGGVLLAQRIAERIRENEGVEVPVGILDITPFRDDRKQTGPDRTRLDFDVTGKNIVLVDDVLYTGRSARAAMDAVIRRGRPGSVQLAVLIDRGHRELPIRPDYIGKNVPTSREEKINVRLGEKDAADCVEILRA